MSHLTLCDRCYRKIMGSPHHLTLIPSATGNSGGDTFDLCLDCKTRFDEWMKSAETVEKTLMET